MSKSYKLPSQNMPSYENSDVSPSISNARTFFKKVSKLFYSTIPGQNTQCTNSFSKSVSCSTGKRKRVNSVVNVIRENIVNVGSDSVINCVSPRPSSSLETTGFPPQC